MASFAGGDPSPLLARVDDAAAFLSCPGSLPHRAGLGVLTYTVCAASSAAGGCEARRLRNWTRAGRWQGTRVGDEHLTLRLAEHAMVNYIEFDSKNVGAVEVHAATSNKRGRFSVARGRTLVPQGRPFRLRLGFLPCKYLKIVCLNPKMKSGLSIWSLRLVGMRGSSVQLGLGPRLHNLLMTETENICFPSQEVAALDEAPTRALSRIADTSEAGSVKTNDDDVYGGDEEAESTADDDHESLSRSRPHPYASGLASSALRARMGRSRRRTRTVRKPRSSAAKKKKKKKKKKGAAAAATAAAAQSRMKARLSAASLSSSAAPSTRQKDAAGGDAAEFRWDPRRNVSQSERRQALRSAQLADKLAIHSHLN